MRDPFESTLPDWVGDALREPVDSHPDARARIMDAVRTLPNVRARAVPMRPSRWLRRGVLSPLGGAMTTVVMVLAVMLRIGAGAADLSDIVTVTRILGDSVVPTRHAGADARDGSAPVARWLDTMRVVEFVLRGSSVQGAAVLGDFNRWQRGATPLVAVGHHEWRARVLVPRDALTMAYLVNDAQLIPSALR